MSLSILGAGAFGTALAISLSRNGPLTLWGREVQVLAASRENTARLPGISLPDPIHITDDLHHAALSQTILLAVPMQKLRGLLENHAGLLAGKRLVACCKGIELETGLGPVSIIRETVPDAAAAILTGPSFAADIARGLPTALTLACADEDTGALLQKDLTTANLRVYRTTDCNGAELGGALKNVIAIACGVAIGAGLGESARAALMTRGFAEMQGLARYRHAEPRTLAGLSGFGDLTLTCTSEQSRNYRLGLALGRGSDFDPDTTVEGAATARAVHALAQKAGLAMPITAAVTALLNGEVGVAGAMQDLLNRPLKEE